MLGQMTQDPLAEFRIFGEFAGFFVERNPITRCSADIGFRVVPHELNMVIRDDAIKYWFSGRNGRHIQWLCEMEIRAVTHHAERKPGMIPCEN